MGMFRYVSFLVCVLFSTDKTTNSVMACKLIPADLGIRDELASFANDATYKLIKLKVDIEDTNITSGTLYSESVYLPQQWMIATSARGKYILMLRDYYSPMSLFTLSLCVAEVDISLKQQPVKCLDNTPIAEIAKLVRDSILDNFESESSLPMVAEVCSQQVVTKEADASKVVYVCCKQGFKNGKAVLCTENNETKGIKVLFTLTLIIQVIMVMFFPVLLPNTMFKAKSVFRKFLFQTEADKSLVMNVKCEGPSCVVGDSFVKTKQHVFAEMKAFRKYLDKMTPGKFYKIYANGIDMLVLESQIIPDGSVPVGLVNYIFDVFARFAVRLDMPLFRLCCNAVMFRWRCINIRWYQCLRYLRMFVCVAMWILRCVFYYTYEKDSLSHKQELYEKLGFHIPFNGSLVSYLSPFHPVFIVIYVLLVITFGFYIFIRNDFRRKLEFPVRKCFRAMHERSIRNRLASYVNLLRFLFPDRYFIYSSVLCLIMLPSVLTFLILEALPFTNLACRLTINLVYYTLRLFNPTMFNVVPKAENNSLKRSINNRLAAILVTDFQEELSRCNKFIYALSLSMTLLSSLSILILVADCLLFLVECIVYVLIGLTFNPLFTHKYLFYIFLMSLYGWKLCTSVKDRYVAFSKAINSKVQSMIGDRLQNVASQNAKNRVNCAFRIENKGGATEPLILVAGSNGYLKWQSPRLVLFLDSSDIPLIPKPLFMRLDILQHSLYLATFARFLLIVSFLLLFVFIIIFAFGQAHHILSIVMIGTVLLPLIAKMCLYKFQNGPSADTSNMEFDFNFFYAVKNHDRWNFEDIHITKMTEMQPLNISSVSVDGHVDLLVKRLPPQSTDGPDLEYYVHGENISLSFKSKSHSY